ncbi:unnamed protein product [Mycena citricolor]|uniref:Phosphatidylglycerol/phosphatidylinositol transfer protein n=1 Tax=Mycena citricolor TaxID=2018698 RepID=A0AAD2HQH5_9AGAR|nr:unnamed protein product [Mycena citricolor]
MSRVSLYLFLFLFLGVTHAASWEYVDCGSSGAIQLESLELFPDPPLPGQDLTVKASAYVTEPITDGASADVTVKLGRIKLLQKTFDVCEEARSNNMTINCPVETGFHVLEQTVALPKEIPQTKFTIAVRGFTEAGKDMLCLDLKLDFMKPLSAIFGSPF